MSLLRLALLSLRNRWLTALLTVLAIAFSVALFLGVEKVRTGARVSFADTISGTDLIVGARSGGVQLLLYSIFHIGNATNNVSWESYRDIAARDEIEWIVPLSLGDSHRGFRVLGTSAAFFDRYRYRGDRGLVFTAGGPFGDLFDAVVGADVAAQLGYALDDPLVITHGLGEIAGADHDDMPFRIAGVLAKTGTPVDRTVLVSLEAIEAIHVDWQTGTRLPGPGTPVDAVRTMDLQPNAITAAMIGVKSRLTTFKLQRWINGYREEPLLAILPGATLQELWDLIGTAETALTIVSAMVVATALLGMVTMIFSTLNERRREMAILRAVGARPRVVMSLLMAEAGLLSLAGVIVGLVVLYASLLVARPIVDAAFGLYIRLSAPDPREWLVLAAVVLAGLVASGFPALRAYRISLADGMTIRS